MWACCTFGVQPHFCLWRQFDTKRFPLLKDSAFFQYFCNWLKMLLLCRMLARIRFRRLFYWKQIFSAAEYIYYFSIWWPQSSLIENIHFPFHPPLGVKVTLHVCCDFVWLRSGWREPIFWRILPRTITTGGPLDDNCGSWKRQDAQASVLYFRMFFWNNFATELPQSVHKVVCRINKWKTNDSFAATCEGRKFFSADELAENDESLNSLTSAGFPPHELEVKIGCPVITLLRNLNPKIVLCAMEWSWL